MTIDEILTALDARLRTDQAITDTPSGHRVEYLYAVDAEATRQARALTVRLLARPRRPDGTWDRPVPAVITEEAALRTSATDRRLLGPLLGARRVGSTHVIDPSGNVALVVTLPDALALDWVPLAARAGRLILRETPDYLNAAAPVG